MRLPIGLETWWWWHIGRRIRRDNVYMKLAWLVPRPIAYWCFIRVYACTGEAPGPEYVTACKAWESGKGK